VKHFLAILLISCSTFIVAQTTAIPDANFEQALINQGFDIAMDGQVLTANIDTLTNLDVSNLAIADLTGIQAFISLTNLDCDGNLLTTLDVTQNTLLVDLGCDSNQIWLLDLSQNILLTYLSCEANDISSLDLSLNPVFRELDCSNNQWLQCLDMQNGNNLNVTFFYAINCPFSCVQVDSVAYSVINWTNIDSPFWYSESCSICGFSGIDELSSSSVSIHPNPTTSQLSISLEKGTATSVTLRNSLGQLLLSDKIKATNHVAIDLSTYPIGIYFLQLEVDGKLITKKVVKE
jgi:hypothetical protein